MAGVGATQMIEFGLQLLTPVVLVRVLDAEVFAGYRWVWLLASTVASIAPMGMVVSLFYFLPRSPARAKLQFIVQTAVHLLGMTALMAATAWAWRDMLPGEQGLFGQHGWALAAFVVLWGLGSLLDQLPTADERVRWQMAVSVGLAVVRSAALVGAAWHSQTLAAILYVLLAFVVLKLGLLLYYVLRFHSQHDWAAERARAHAAHAWPLGAGTVLFGLRRQVEQWMVAAMFSPVQFASFSIAATLAPVMLMARRSVGLVLMPSMSRAESQGDLKAMLRANQSGNMVVARFLSPLLAAVAIHADTIVNFIYTTQYTDAANVLRVFVVLWFLQMIDLNALVVMMREGNFVSKINLPLLALAAAGSYAGAQAFGLPGAALGSVCSTYLERVLLARRLSAKVGVPLREFQLWGKVLLLALTCLIGFGLLRLAAGSLHAHPMLSSGAAFALAALLGFFGAKRAIRSHFS